MKHAALLTLSVLILTPGIVVPQTPQEQDTLAELKSIYESIEYKDHHQDLAESWQIADRDLIRAIFSELWANGALRKKGGNGSITEGEKDSIVKDILYEDRLGVVCRKRYYDDEIGHLEFVGADPHQLEPLDDWVYISGVLGSELYDKIKKRDYRFIKANKSVFESQRGFSYDIYLHVTTPEVMLFSVSTDTRNCQQWMFSFFGEMGDDFIDLPFWYKGTMTAGGKLVFVDSREFRKYDRDYHKFGVSIGWESPINFSVGGGSTTGMFKERKTIGSSKNIFFRTTYSSSHDWPIPSPQRDGYLELSLSGSLKIQEMGRNDYAINIPRQFYSINNSLTFFARMKHLANVFDYGSLDLSAGVSWHDLNHFNRDLQDPKAPEKLVNDDPTKGVTLPSFEVGITRDGSLLQYGLATQVNYSPSGHYGFIVVKTLLMLSNSVGIDFRYFKGLNVARIPPWQYDNYIVVSPILRINY